ncbi:MAG: efflux RND transporter periplasmic adaptor subunit [Deltaproteobacteria bacterium]|nr:efflux RND transporter periplasmic adaptor subunit [Deltaproteobacteria bacterium]
MKSLTKIALRSVIGLAFLTIAVLALLWWNNSGTTNTMDRSFQTASVRRGTLELTVSSTGTLAAVETVAVGTEVSGTVEKVLVDYNDQVTMGQVLAALKPGLFTAAVADAQGKVDQASAELDLAQKDLARNLPLFEKGYLSAQEFLPYRINADKAKAALDSAQAGLVRARINLDNSVVRSPIAGTVIQRSVDAGQTVAASLNTPTLFIIAKDLARMQIEAAVDETDIGQIRQGQQVRFSVQSYPEQTFTGSVRQVRLQPTTVQNVVTYTVIVAANNDQGLLLPGMTATVDFIVEQAQDALLVPSAALRFQPTTPGKANDSNVPRAKSGSRVFVVDAADKLSPVPITVGISDGQLTVVTEGELQEGAAVVTGYKQNTAKPKAGFSLFGSMRGRPRR